MGLQGGAAIVGIADDRPLRHDDRPRRFTLEQWADLAARALADAGLGSRDVDGIVCAGDVRESGHFTPATVAEYCGWEVNLAEKVDLGGAGPVGMVWRAAAAVELGICDVVVCATVSRPIPDPPAPQPPDERIEFGASSNLWGSPQAEFDIPWGNVAQNCGYAMIAQRYGALYGYDERAMAKLAVDQRTNALAHPDAVFHGQPLTVEDVLASRMIADPLHLLEIVMPCWGGAAIVVAGREAARRGVHRPARVIGFGEHVSHKTPTYTRDLVVTPVAAAARQAFGMAGVTPADVDVVELYDCYTITALLSIEDSGFCGKGEGMAFVRDHDLTYAGDFPCNTHGGQLSYGQAGLSGGMSQVVEAVRQLRGGCGERQVPGCDVAYVTGTGGVMSEQAALVLAGGW
jgi:acetyl-CoA acetyltransferase